LISYLVVRRYNIINNIIDTLSMVPYIIPGSVVGIAMVMAFNKGPLVLTGTAMIMVIAMCIRRIPYTIRSSVAVLGQIPISVEEAAISLGAGKTKTLVRITVPMMFSGIVSGAIMSWVTLITELSSSIILYSSKTITLNLGVDVMGSRGKGGKALAGCLSCGSEGHRPGTDRVVGGCPAVLVSHAGRDRARSRPGRAHALVPGARER